MYGLCVRLQVYEELYKAKIFAEVNLSSKTLNKKVREGQLEQYNFILVVGAKEQESKDAKSKRKLEVAARSTLTYGGSGG